MMEIRRMPAFPARTLFTYLYRTSVGDYFHFLEQKVSRLSPKGYRIIRERLCSSLLIHKTGSLLDLMRALYKRLHEIQREVEELYSDEFMYDDAEDIECDSKNGRRLKAKLKEQQDLYTCLYFLFIQPLLNGIGDTGTWGEQMKQRLCNYYSANENQ